MKKVFAALIGLISIALPQSAIAQTVFYKEGGSDVVLTFEGTASAPFSASIWTLRNRAIVANPCGLAIISTADHPMQFIGVGGNQINYASLPIQSLVTCSGGVLSEPRPANFRLADGKTVLVGQTAGSSVNVQYLAKSARTGTFNACGLRAITLKNTAAIGADSIQVDFGGQSQSLGDINQVLSTPICKKIGGNSVKYIKLN